MTISKNSAFLLVTKQFKLERVQSQLLPYNAVAMFSLGHYKAVNNKLRNISKCTESMAQRKFLSPRKIQARLYDIPNGVSDD